VLYNIIGCTKNDTPSEPQPLPSIYKADDSTTGIFNFTGIVYDTIQAIDSIYPPNPISPTYPSGYLTKFNTYTHQVSGQIRIQKLISDSTIIYLSSPINDNYDTASRFSGMIFQIGAGYVFAPYGHDTIIKANYLNNILRIPYSAYEHVDVRWNFMQLSSGNGRFVYGNWEINYQISGEYTERPWENPMPSFLRLYGYHTYHLTCVKQH
jgi:hypothetical protein